MKKLALFLVLVLLTFLAGTLYALVSTRMTARRCFVIIETTTGNDLSAVFGIGRVGKESEDVSALQAGLKALREVGEVRVAKLKTYSVVFVKIGHGNTSALDREIEIDFFTGSPVGLLQRVSKESGTRWRCPESVLIPSADMYAEDSITRVTVKDFRGSIRQLLAETIPPSYGSMALSVLCRSDGTVEVRHYGHRHFPEEKFRADHFVGALPKAVRIRPEEMENEGTTLLKRPGESDDQYLVRFDKHLLQKLRESK